MLALVDRSPVWELEFYRRGQRSVLMCGPLPASRRQRVSDRQQGYTWQKRRHVLATFLAELPNGTAHSLQRF
jgi:hypothetical protein